MTSSVTETRGHRGLFAVSIVIGSALALWLATIVLVRYSANERLREEIARLRATGIVDRESSTLRPEPAPVSDGLPLLRRALESWLARDTSRASARDASDLWNDSFHNDYQLRRAAIEPDAALLALVREAAARTAIWYAPSSENYRNDLAIALAIRVLESSAVTAAQDGDDESARADCVRLLQLREAVGARPWHPVFYLQTYATERAAVAVAAALASPNAQRNWLEFDPQLAAIDPSRRVRGQWRIQVADLLEAYSFPASRSPSVWREWPPSAATFGWPEAELARVHTLAELTRYEPFIDRGVSAVLGAPGFKVPVMISGCLSGDPRDWDKHVAPAAREEAIVMLTRAALRARFDGAAAADAFLAQQTDPFTGGKLHARIAEDGTWTAWCTGTYGSAASPDAPDPRYDVVWPPQP